LLNDGNAAELLDYAHGQRLKLKEAAIDVVGRLGYAEATIARITAAAGVSTGTFYLYFENQQALFDQLLPTMGERLAEHIEGYTSSDAVGLAYEAQRIRAYFDFCERNRGFLRIYHEAAIFAPKAYRLHFDSLAERYRQSIRQSRETAQLPRFGEEEIEGLVHMLMGARAYLSQLHASANGDQPASRLIETYLKVVEFGVYGNMAELPSVSAPLSGRRPRKVGS